MYETWSEFIEKVCIINAAFLYHYKGCYYITNFTDVIYITISSMHIHTDTCIYILGKLFNVTVSYASYSYTYGIVWPIFFNNGYVRSTIVLVEFLNTRHDVDAWFFPLYAYMPELLWVVVIVLGNNVIFYFSYLLFSYRLFITCCDYDRN